MRQELDREKQFIASGVTPGFANAPVIFERGKGAKLWDLDGKEYIDFCAGTFTNALGHCHPELVSFMQQRVAELWNIHDYSTPYKLPLLENLARLTPPHINKFQFYSGGSETIEAGVRALRSFLPESRQRFAAFAGGYHGKTRGARSLYHWNFPGEAASQEVVLPFPDHFDLSEQDRNEVESDCLSKIESLFAADPAIGAVVFEPILGAGGNLHASKEFWQSFQSLCEQYQVLLFADEICVGFGRTGQHFAFQNYDLEPDLVAFAKGLASGFPAMVLAGRQEIMDAKPFGEQGGASTTFGGNPLAIAAMYKTTSIYLESELDKSVTALVPTFYQHVSTLSKQFSEVISVRMTGLMATLKLTVGDEQQSKKFALALHKHCIELGLKVMTFDQLFRIYPPLNISDDELQTGFDILSQAFAVTLSEFVQEVA